MLQYEIDISFKRTLLPLFQIHTKSKYQFQESQIVAYTRLAIWNSRFNGDSNRLVLKAYGGL